MGCGGGTLLQVVPDESSTEKRMAGYLTERGLKVMSLDESAGDQILYLDFDKDEHPPALQIVIDTDISNKNNGHVDGRVVMVRLLSHVMVPPERRAATLPVINAHHAAVWASCLYINEKDGEIEGQWPIDIEARYAVDPAQVQDARDRLIESWSLLYPKLAGVIDGKPEAVAEAAPR